MSGKQLLQSASSADQERGRTLDGPHGSGEFFGAHVLGLLRLEQAAVLEADAAAALALDDLSQVHSRFAADALQFIFHRTPNRRFVSSTFLG